MLGQTCRTPAWAKAMSPAFQSLQGRREVLSPPQASKDVFAGSSRPDTSSLKRTSPSYLYLKGNLFYFRYAFPKVYRDRLGRAEIRISLETGYKREARARAMSLHSKLQIFLASGVMDDYQEIRQQLKDWLVQLLEEKQKVPVSQREIRERLNGYLCELLDDDDRNVEPRQTVEISGVELTSGQISNRYANMLRYLVDRPEALIDLSLKVIPMLCSEGVFKKEEISKENFLQITKSYLKAQITNHKIKEAREKGDYLPEQKVFFSQHSADTQKNLHYENNFSSEADKGNFLVSELIEKYINAKLSDGVWKTHSVSDHRGRLSYLIEVLGNRVVGDITRSDMRLFRETIRRLPPNRTKRKEYRGKSIKDLIEIEHEVVLNVKTVNMIVEAVSSLFEWGVREGYLGNNPAKSLSIKDERQAISLREAFDCADLKKIFLSQKYIENEFKHPSFYWAPLIGLFTGMRLEEICQLNIEDVYESNVRGVFVIDINSRMSEECALSKTLKNKNAVRIIPVHQVLVDIGFVDYCKHAGQLKYDRIFPELRKTDASPKYGKQPGKAFGKLVREVGVQGNKSFHSLRHTFSDFYKSKGMHNDMFRQIFGHEIVELAGRQYGSKFDVGTCYEQLISVLDYGIDFSKLKFSL